MLSSVVRSSVGMKLLIGATSITIERLARPEFRLLPAQYELTGLQVTQVSLNQGVVRVFGKGSKERLVPMGEEAQLWLQRYMKGPRAELLGGVPCDVVHSSSVYIAIARTGLQIYKFGRTVTKRPWRSSMWFMGSAAQSLESAT